jgi:hypothetical protein
MELAPYSDGSLRPKNRSLTVAAPIGVYGCKPSRDRQGAVV